MAQEDVVATKESAPVPVESPKKPAQEPTPAAEDLEKPTEKPDATPVTKSGSFKEESNLVSDLQEPEKKALDDLKSLLQSSIANNEFTTPPPPTTEPAPPAAEEPAEPEEEPAKPDAAGSSTQDPPSPPSETATDVQEKTVVVDDDGAKTVEAIESTVVPVTPPAPLAAPAGPAEQEKIPDENIVASEDVFIWDVPLLKDERSDTILLKFLRARDFKPKEAMAMIKDTVKWRKEFGIEKLMEAEDLEVSEMEKAVFMSGVDRQGHPVCYNAYGEFQNKELYDKAFGDGEKRQKFLRWRIQYLEKGIRELLDFSPGGVSTMVQVTDLKNSPGLLKSELRQALDLLQNNYPEFAAKQVFINVPWWYLAFNKMISPFLTQRTKSKFVFAGPSKSAETLFSYIAPEQVPVQFGGLSQENDFWFTTADVVTEVNMKPNSKQIIEIPVTEKCLLVWELRVLGWDVSVGAEFVPSSEESYTVIIQKSKKFTANDEAVAKNSFKIGEPGKVLLTVDNASSKKKKLLYRYNAKDCAE